MSFLDKIRSFLSKLFFGYDKNYYENKIKILKTKIEKLQTENTKLKIKLKQTEEKLLECEENIKHLKSKYKLFQFHIYFSIRGRKKGTITNFEIILKGIVDSNLNKDDIILTFNNKGMIAKLLSISSINIGTAEIINNTIGGYTESLMKDVNKPSDYITGYIDIDSYGRQYPFVIDNMFKDYESIKSTKTNVYDEISKNN